MQLSPDFSNEQYVFQDDSGVWLTIGLNHKGSIVVQNLQTSEFKTVQSNLYHLILFNKVVINPDRFFLRSMYDQELREKVCQILNRKETL